MSEERELWQITTGEYSEYLIIAFVEGPVGASLADLWREFDGDGDAEDLQEFARWLCDTKGFRRYVPPKMQEFNVEGSEVTVYDREKPKHNESLWEYAEGLASLRSKRENPPIS